MDEEPELKYSLLTNSLKDTIRDESITAFQVSFHFIILGTINGTVFVLDLIGNLLKTYENHAGRVNCIAIDSSEEYMSSGGEDGNVVVQSLYTAECQITSGKYPITCIQFEPDYSKMSRGLLSGGRQGELVLASKGWFGVSRLVIDSVESPILAAYWRSDYIVWITSNIAKFYNYKSASHFGHIDFDSANAYENFEPTVAWKSNEELIIGYKDSIRLVEIKDRDPKDVASGLSSKYVECKQQISVDFICCGVAPYKDMLLALGLRSDLNNNSAPQMYIVENDGEILSNDTLSLSNPKDMKVYAKEYQLGYQISENLSDTVYYIVSPWSIIVSKPRDVKDRVQWLLKFNEFERALQEIENSKNVYSQREKRETIITVGTKYIDKLLEENEFSQAASVCPRVYKQSAENWEAVVYKFAHHRKIHILYSVLPTENPVLSQNTYDIASQEFLEQDIELLYKAVKEWPFAIYSTSIIIKSIEALLTLTENQSVTLYLILSHL